MRRKARELRADKHIALVLLDRDGVLCDNSAGGVLRYADFKFVPGLAKSLHCLSSKFRVGVITNQPYVRRGQMDIGELRQMDRKLTDAAMNSGIRPSNFTIKECIHDEPDKCNCRKPKTGLVEQVVKHFNLDIKKVRFYSIGDKFTDLETMENYYRRFLRPCGVSRSNVTTIFLSWKYSDPSRERVYKVKGDFKIVPDITVRSLASAVSAIMLRERRATA